VAAHSVALEHRVLSAPAGEAGIGDDRQPISLAQDPQRLGGSGKEGRRVVEQGPVDLDDRGGDVLAIGRSLDLQALQQPSDAIRRLVATMLVAPPAVCLGALFAVEPFEDVSRNGPA
jgi:hypothetical protein